MKRLLFFTLFICSFKFASFTPFSPTNMMTAFSPTGIPYYPCQSWISFSVDDSNNLEFNAFMTQLQFAVEDIGAMNHPERIQALGFNGLKTFWTQGTSIREIQENLYSLRQKGGYSLRTHFKNIILGLNLIQNTNSPINAIIFISDTSDLALTDAELYTSQLTNVSITFVLLGPNLDYKKLNKFNPKFVIFWDDLTQLQPDNWQNIYLDVYGCSFNASPTPFSQCVDNASDCNQTMNDCKNAVYKPLLCKYCQKSCNLCDDPACVSAK